MRYCTNCGAELGLGRFCTNCGAPIAPTSPVTATPPPAVAPPAAPPPAAPLPGTPPTAHVRRDPRRPGVSMVWVSVLVLALVGAAALGTWLATRDTGAEPVSGAEPTPATTSPEDSPTTSPDGQGEDDGDDVNDLAPHTHVTAPPPMEPGLDLHNNPVSYAASNMLDDDPQTAYRLPGDATGTVITFELPQATTISEVGLVNGYTKVDSSGSRMVDWYVENRRILEVEWAFDDGSTVTQSLDATIREIQAIEVPEVETTSIRLTILGVSSPGTGPLSKDATAISDVLLLGS